MSVVAVGLLATVTWMVFLVSGFSWVAESLNPEDRLRRRDGVEITLQGNVIRRAREGSSRLFVEDLNLPLVLSLYRKCFQVASRHIVVSAGNHR